MNGKQKSKRVMIVTLTIGLFLLVVDYFNGNRDLNSVNIIGLIMLAVSWIAYCVLAGYKREEENKS